MILFYSGGTSGKTSWPEDYGLPIMLSYFELRDGEGDVGIALTTSFSCSIEKTKREKT